MGARHFGPDETGLSRGALKPATARGPWRSAESLIFNMLAKVPHITMRIVVDTNVLLGACLGTGAANAVIAACLNGRCLSLIGNALFSEYGDVFGRDNLFAKATGRCFAQWVDSWEKRPAADDHSRDLSAPAAVIANAGTMRVGQHGTSWIGRVVGGGAALVRSRVLVFLLMQQAATTINVSRPDSAQKDQFFCHCLISVP